MAEAAHTSNESREKLQDVVHKEMKSLLSQWRREREKLAARRQVEQYLELRRLREQIGDIFDLEDL